MCGDQLDVRGEAGPRCFSSVGVFSPHWRTHWGADPSTTAADAEVEVNFLCSLFFRKKRKRKLRSFLGELRELVSPVLLASL